MQHGGDADAGAEMLGVGGDGDQGLGGGLQQNIVDHGLVLVGDVGDRSWQGEDDVEIGYRQQLGLACGQPVAVGGALAFRARAVSAGLGLVAGD